MLDKDMSFEEVVSRVATKGGICDCLLSYTPKGRLNLTDIKDQDKMSAMFADMPLSFPLVSMIRQGFLHGAAYSIQL